MMLKKYKSILKFYERNYHAFLTPKLDGEKEYIWLYRSTTRRAKRYITDKDREWIKIFDDFMKNVDDERVSIIKNKHEAKKSVLKVMTDAHYDRSNYFVWLERFRVSILMLAASKGLISYEEILSSAFN